MWVIPILDRKGRHRGTTLGCGLGPGVVNSGQLSKRSRELVAQASGRAMAQVMAEAAMATWEGACCLPSAGFAPGGPWAVEAAPSNPWGRAVRDLPVVDIALLPAETSGSCGVIATPPIRLEEDWRRQLEEGFVSQLYPCPQWHTECNWHTRSVPWPVTKKAERKILDSISLKPFPYLIGKSEWAHLIIQKKLRMTSWKQQILSVGFPIFRAKIATAYWERGEKLFYN